MRITILALYMALFVIACGGSSTPSTTKEPADQTKIGVFIDAPVKGLAYTSLPSGKKGTTNEKGEFEYIDGDIVSFNMGSIELGNAVPDKDKNVKVTQLKEAILVAQLLQVLDADADENKIDVSDIVIPEVIQGMIVEKLKRTENQTQDNIISKEQFEAIKQKNPKKLTLQQRSEVISKNKVLEHVKQQIGESDLRFSASGLKSLYLIEASLLNNFDGITIGFSDENSPAIQIDVKNNLATKSISTEISRSEWEIDPKGRLSLSSNGSTCKITKIAEDSDVMDVSYSCVDENNGLGLSRLVKPQPFSANDLSGKSFNFKSHNGHSETLDFGNNGEINCNGDESCTYKTHPIHKNTVWIQGGGDNSDGNTLMILAKGTLTKGKLLMIHYDAKYNLNSVEVMETSGNALVQKFESDDNNESTDHNNNTDDNSDSKDNSESDKQKNETEEAKEEAKEIKDPKEDGNEDTDNHLDSGKQKQSHIPITQDMLLNKTFYDIAFGKYNDNLTLFFGPDQAGKGSYGLYDQVEYTDMTFNYSIDADGYLTLSNVENGENGISSYVIVLLDNNDVLKICWGISKSNFEDNCKYGEIKFLYQTADEAEAKDRKQKEKSDNNSGYKDNSDSGTQNPTYVPFTQEIISEKTLYNVYTDGDDENDSRTGTLKAGTFTFDSSGRGKAMYGLHDSISNTEATFDYSIDAKGYLVLSNWAFTNPEEAPDDHSESKENVIALIADSEDSLKICWRDNLDALDKGCSDDESFFKNKEAAEAFLALNALPKSTYNHSGSGIQSPTYMPFTQEILVGEKFFSVANDDDYPDLTLIFELKGGAIWFNLANLPDKPIPDVTFDYMIDSQGFIVISNIEGKSDSTGETSAIGLLGMENNSPIICWGDSASKITNFCKEDNQNVWYLTKEAAEAEKAARIERVWEDDKENTKNSEPAPYIPFPQEILSGKTFYDVGKDENLTLFFGDDNKGHLWSGLTDSTTSPDLEFDYRVDSEGFIVLSNVFSRNSHSDDTPIIGLLGKGVREHSLVTCWGKSASEITDFCEEDDKHIWYFTMEAAIAEVRAHGSVEDDPKPIPVTYIPFTRGMLSGQTLYGVGNDLDVTINFDTDNTGHATTHIAVGTHIPVGTDYDHITFDYLVDSHGLLILQNTKINGRDQTDTILGLIESSHGPKVCWGDESMYENKTSGFCIDEDIVALYRTKQLALNAQLKRDVPPKENNKENTDKNSDSSTQTLTYIPFTQEMLSGKILYVPSVKLPLTMYYGTDNKGYGQVGISDDNVMTEPLITFDYQIDSDGFLIFSDVSITNDLSTMGLIESSDKTLKVCWDDESSYDINDFCKEEDLVTFYTNLEDAEIVQIRLMRDYQIELENKQKNIPFTQDMLSSKHFYDLYFGPKLHEMTLFFDDNQTGKGINGFHEQIEDEDMTFDYTIDKDGHLTLSNINILRNSHLYFVDITEVTYEYSIALNNDYYNAITVCWGKSKSELEKPYTCRDGQLKNLYKTIEEAKAAQELNKNH